MQPFKEPPGPGATAAFLRDKDPSGATLDTEGARLRITS